MATRKPQTVSRRAKLYAAHMISSAGEAPSVEEIASHWAGGYRRAMADVRRILNNSTKPLYDLDQLSKPERMK